MTTVHAHLIGDKALLSFKELDHLVKLAQQTEQVTVRIEDDPLPTFAMMRLAEQGGAFEFWNDEGEEIYSEKDGESV